MISGCNQNIGSKGRKYIRHVFSAERLIAGTRPSSGQLFTTSFLLFKRFLQHLDQLADDILLFYISFHHHTVMKTDLQQAALQKLAALTHHGQLPFERRTAIRDRILKRCHDQKKLSNGVNGVNGVNGASRVMVCNHPHPSVRYR